MKYTDSKSNDILDEIIIQITEDNEREMVSALLNALFGRLSVEGENDSVPGQKFMEKLLKRLPKPYTVVHENYHIDSSYRDTYYMYFSNQHFDVPRYSRRFSFFRELISYSDFIDSTRDEFLQNNFIGACVFNPLGSGLIGRTLIDPLYIVDEIDYPVYVRTSVYVMNILGQRLEVKAFPFRMQDQETMSCAEVTLLNILEHYSNSYNDYRKVNPSEIIAHEQVHSHERVLPAKGMTYPILTKVLADFGFSPRLYNLYAIKNHNFSKITRKDELKRWLHYYVESGIPVAINLNPIGNYGAGHSVVCIGHGKEKDALKAKARKNKLLLWGKENNHPIINSADFYDDYVIMDDNQFLYQLRNFDNITLYPDMQVVNLTAPLYKRMFLDAPDAADTIVPILQHGEYGITAWAGNHLGQDEEVVIRIFMASSRGFKNYRVKTMIGSAERMLYANMRLPRFIWVCELYTNDGYEKKEAFGEIVLDATSASNRGHRSLLMMHYPDVISLRNPDDKNVGFDVQYELTKAYTFKAYQQNLTIIGHSD
ncbi:MAG: hypothetical protein NC429_10010 [Lachnospiraceae bacterium]|nr:hypothetical protein [Lachnospiraceae bacterium]